MIAIIDITDPVDPLQLIFVAPCGVAWIEQHKNENRWYSAPLISDRRSAGTFREIT